METTLDTRTFRIALMATWVVISTVMMLAVLTPFVLPADRVYGMFPACEARLRGEPCVLCGMTTAWVLLAQGNLGGALESNRWSLALWGASIVNFAIVKTFLLLSLLRRRPPVIQYP